MGYRSSLTEVVQIIGRVTRGAPGKERARFTNLIAEPLAEQSVVVDAVNDTLKAISASLLMEQVQAPRWEYTPKDSGAKPGYVYGEGGYKAGANNVGYDEQTGSVHVEINGLKEPLSAEATRICREDLTELVTSSVQNKDVVSRGLFDADGSIPQENTQLRMGEIVRDRYPELDEADIEAIRQRAVTAMITLQGAKQQQVEGEKVNANFGLIEGVRRLVLSVRDLSVDLIDSINPFGEAYAVLARTMNSNLLEQSQLTIAAQKVNLSFQEAYDLAKRAVIFKRERGRAPLMTAHDPWEKRMAEGIAAYKRYLQQRQRAGIADTVGQNA